MRKKEHIDKKELVSLNKKTTIPKPLSTWKAKKKKKKKKWVDW
jgi:hypothetical protein